MTYYYGIIVFMSKGKNLYMHKKKLFVVTATTLATLGLVATATDSAKANEVKDEGNTYWVVESGDTLSKISEKYKVDFPTVHANNLDKVSDANVIFVGQKLLVGGKDFRTDSKPTEVQEPVKAEVTYQVDTAPVVEQAHVVEQAPSPVELVEAQLAPAQTSDAKEWIAGKESSGSYDARNGRYIGRYQLDSSYLNGDYSQANQERVADAYVASRYGSWESARSFWLANGWY